jgi:hypothetical protein
MLFKYIFNSVNLNYFNIDFSLTKTYLFNSNLDMYNRQFDLMLFLLLTMKLCLYFYLMDPPASDLAL